MNFAKKNDEFSSVIEKFHKYLLYLFVILATCSGVFGYLAYLYDNPMIRLWKEGIVIFWIASIYLTHFAKISVRQYSILVLIFFIFFLFSLYSFFYIGVNIQLILYQMKNDLLVTLFAFFAYIFIKNIEKREEYILILTQLIVYCGLLNAIAMILEFSLFEEFLNLIGLSVGNWGSSVGIKIITSGAYLRAPGLQAGFVPAATLSLFSLIIILNNHKIIKKSSIRYFFMLLLFLSILASTYKNAMLGLVIILFFYFINLIKMNNIIKIILEVILASTVFMMLFISTHFYSFYDLIAEVDPYYAYNSIYIRIVLFKDILNQMIDFPTLFFGLGLGLNGTYGLDKEIYGIYAIPTDSSYIFLASNYGIVGLLVIILFLLYLYIISIKKGCFDIRYIILYTLFIEFFYNNIITNFPINYFLALLCVFLLIKKKNSVLACD
jgi:hypothetical protein